jgi:YHS domain-containing protein
MSLQKVGYKMYTVTYAGKVRYFDSREEARAFMREMEEKFLNLE